VSPPRGREAAASWPRFRPSGAASRPRQQVQQQNTHSRAPLTGTRHITITVHRRRIFCAAATGADYTVLSPSLGRYSHGAPQRRLGAWAAKAGTGPPYTSCRHPCSRSMTHLIACAYGTGKRPKPDRDHDPSGRPRQNQPQLASPEACVITVINCRRGQAVR